MSTISEEFEKAILVQINAALDRMWDDLMTPERNGQKK